jgi:hypothetical protein
MKREAYRDLVISDPDPDPVHFMLGRLEPPLYFDNNCSPKSVNRLGKICDHFRASRPDIRNTAFTPVNRMLGIHKYFRLS